MKMFMKKIRKFIVEWHEIVTIPIAVLLWYFSPSILRLMDPTVATYDAGIFQVLLFATISFLFLFGIVWLYIKISFPGVFKFFVKLDDVYMNDEDPKNKLTVWQKSLIALSFLFICCLSIVLLARII